MKDKNYKGHAKLYLWLVVTLGRAVIPHNSSLDSIGAQSFFGNNHTVCNSNPKYQCCFSLEKLSILLRA